MVLEIMTKAFCGDVLALIRVVESRCSGWTVDEAAEGVYCQCQGPSTGAEIEMARTASLKAQDIEVENGVEFRDNRSSQS